MNKSDLFPRRFSNWPLFVPHNLIVLPFKNTHFPVCACQIGRKSSGQSSKSLLKIGKESLLKHFDMVHQNEPVYLGYEWLLPLKELP